MHNSDGQAKTRVGPAPGTTHGDARAALAESEERFRVAFDNAPIGMALVDMKGRWLHVNQALCRMVGYTEEELIGHPFREITHPEDRELALTELRELLEGARTSFDVEKRYNHKDGHVVWVQVTGAVVRDADGRPGHYVAQMQDITERKRAALELEASEERYRRLVEVSPEAILEHCDGRIVFANEAACRLLRAPSARALLGRPLMGFVQVEDHPRTVERFARVLEGELVPFIEISLIRLDGSLVYCEATGVRTSHQGRPAIQTLIRDLSEREQARAALARRDAHFRALIEHALDVIALADASGTVLFASPSVTRVLGYTLEQFQGKRYLDLVHPDDRPLAERALSQGLASPGKLVSAEIRLRHADGSWRWMEARGRSLLEDPVVQGFIVNARDITDRVEAAEVLRDNEERLRLAEKLEAVGKLAGGIAHDFNNLLTVIMGNAQLLLEHEAVGARKTEIEQILHSAAHAASLTRQLLAVARKQMLRPTLVDVNGVLAGLEPLLRRVLHENIRVQVTVAPELPNVKVDASQLEQVVLNLALNAGDAMPQGGQLAIETGTMAVTQAAGEGELSPGQYVVVSVRDTGFGIPPEHLSKIFDPFFTTKDCKRRTGLGLASVYGIVKQSGGDVFVDSAPGGGSTFRVAFPAAFEPATVPEPAQSQTVAGAPAADELILLVEDEPAVRDLARRVLVRSGYRVLEAGSGEEALVLLDENPGPLRLVVTDVVMPGMDGRELVERLRLRLPDLNVLFVSGYTEDEVLRRGVTSRGEHFLPKPFTPKELLDRTRLLLENASA